MATIKEIREDLKTISTIKTITNVYQEIANFRMNQIRKKVLINREFINGLIEVYAKAKRSYFALLKTGELKEKPIFKKIKKEVILFLSCNKLFHGTLILDIWEKVSEYLKESKGELVVIGRVGKYLAERELPKRKFFYFDLDDDDPKREEIKKIFDFIKDYEKITIFHGRFETILTQKAVQSNIAVEFEVEKGEIKKYLFEPSARAVLEFFEREMMLGFFNQLILEHRLASYATRMVAMYQASEKAKKILEELKKMEKKLKSQILNKKQIELFSNLTL